MKARLYHASYDSRCATLEVVTHEGLLLVADVEVLDWNVYSLVRQQLNFIFEDL